MQYLKDTVRAAIVKEATHEFLEKGYQGASMRNIAKGAQTSTGNLYKYFQGKENLFDAIVGDVYHHLMDSIHQFEVKEGQGVDEALFQVLLERVLQTFEANRIAVTLLLNRSHGSKYEDCKGNFTELITQVVTQVMEQKLRQQRKRLKNNLFIHVISCTLTEGISLILKDCKDDHHARELVQKLVSTLYDHILEKLEVEPLSL